MFPALNVLRKVLHRVLLEVSDEYHRMYWWWMIRYSLTPRFVNFEVTLPGHIKWIAIDVGSFFSMYKAIFLEGVYDFDSKGVPPTIVDAGANIGLSVLYFKLKHPDSKIIALEPDPEIFKVLKHNISRAKLKNVRLLCQAAWIKKGDMSFVSDHADGGQLKQVASSTRVKTVNFKDLLHSISKIEFIKLDIEGAEQKVIPHAFPEMAKAKYVFFEYHHNPREQYKLAALLSSFERHGFSYKLSAENTVTRPFIEKEGTGFDLQVNVFLQNRSQEL